ncbi:MAG: endonuclease [Bacilli bacterium]|nr:endonuclease [Bacilli bacterium]
MPEAPLRPCGKVGCTTLTRAQYCPAHAQLKQQTYNKERGTAAERGYNARWKKARIIYLKRNPLCVCEDCKRTGSVVAATVVDHIIPHKGNYELFWNQNNWQSMSEEHHNRKTAKENGGFGNGF